MARRVEAERVGQHRRGWGRRDRRLRPLDVDIATNTTHNGQLLSIAAVKGDPLRPRTGWWDYGYGRLVRGTWIIVFLGGGWWSALLAFERMVIVERVQSRVRRI